MGRYSLFSVLKIASRKSPLAKIQAYKVYNAIKRLKQDKIIELVFKDSQGDVDLTSPLWKFADKGVFTKDFREDLLSERVDLVVHSWKDLDLDGSPDTEIISVLGRADQRDLLLFKKSSLQKSSNEILILSSSPRREYNLQSFFPLYLPASIQKKSFRFEPVRGNIQTRIKKWESGDFDGIIVAKAAIDRLLSTDFPQHIEEDIKESREYIQKIIQDHLFMCLPLSMNPNAPAQGAIAVEIKKNRDDLKRLLKKLTIEAVDSSVREERSELKKYGGGCHQKIGISVLLRSYGKVIYKQGVTDSGVLLEKKTLISNHHPRSKSIDNLWPNPNHKIDWERISIPTDNRPPKGHLLISRSNAWNDSWKKEDISGVIWSAGLKTMRELAKKDIWVNGTNDGLGEEESPNLGKILPNYNFIKLTHENSYEVESNYQRYSTYKLVMKNEPPNFKNITHFFWMSGYQFEYFYKLFPEIQTAYHSCGPGITRKHIEKILLKDLDVFLSYQDWLDYHTGVE